MKKSFLRFVIINIVIFAAILVNLAFYMLGIIERESVTKLVDKRFQTLQGSIDESNEEIEKILSQVSNDNIAKAKALAIILNQSPGAYLDNEAIEEIRIALNVDEIMITNSSGIVVAGTSPYIRQDFHNSEVEKQFLPAITDKNFAKTVNVNNKDSFSQLAATSRLDEAGIIVIEASDEYFSRALTLAGISNVASGFSILKNGRAAIVSKDSWEYVSHTNEELIGTPVQIPQEKFKNLNTTGKGRFKYNLMGKKSYVFYQEYKGNILVADIPLSEVYLRRNYVLVSMLISLSILSLIVVLAVRKKLIDFNAE